MVSLTVAFCTGQVLLATVFALPYGSQKDLPLVVDDEDPIYLYQSMVKSVEAYKMAKAEGNFGMARADSHVCYDDLGCFFKNGTYGNFWMLPYSPEYINTKFLLYTSATQQDPQLLDYKNSTSLTSSSFRPDWPTTLLVPGFGNKPATPWLPDFKDAVFRSVPEGNYILVDWTEGAKPPNYWAASANTQVVGAQIAKLIGALNTHSATKSSAFHIVGYSLGAHVAGFTRHKLVQAGHERVGRITALDPAGPIFEDGHDDAILNTGDADFVSGIHANGATLSQGGFGLYKRVGDIDFYPNGGQYQPGCPHAIWGAIGNLFSFNFGDLPESVKCNHHRAVLLAVEALDPVCAHHSYACENWESFKEGSCDPAPDGNMYVFGSHLPSELPHFLVTKDVTGFCANALKVTFNLAAGSVDSVGNIFVTFVGPNGVEETIEQLAEEEEMPSGKSVVEVLPSRFSAAALTQVKVKYEPDCGWFSCYSDRLEVDSITVENLSDKTSSRCAGFQILFKDETVVVDLTECASAHK